MDASVKHVARPTKFGRYQVAEPFRFDNEHLHLEGNVYHEVSWRIPIPVLDQEDLHAQGINCGTFIPNGGDPDALGSCTANATMASVSERYVTSNKAAPLGLSGNAVNDEKCAIKFYHACTDQTGEPSQEWPPTDCGSTGLYCCQELIRQAVIKDYKTATGALAALSLLQNGTVIEGTPWFYAWMTPDSQGYVDGDGSYDALMAAVESGVAGGHETCIHAAPQVAQASNGSVNLASTVFRVRNSWSKTWGLDGDFLLHASTLQYLVSYVDYKQFVLA